ncbi:MAG: hypothetical protein HKP58_16490 [Desulfatitalea sp.]|nr:hypothetical protein [Desulfatitalea sp.]NNK02012.1 hypothetical protein [Desulfatitalea sp.]
MEQIALGVVHAIRLRCCRQPVPFNSLRLNLTQLAWLTMDYVKPSHFDPYF